MKTPFLGLLLLVLLTGSCSIGRITRTESVTDETSSVGSSISIHGSSAEAHLDRGKQYVLEGHFTHAMGEFEQAYTTPGADPKFRAEALFELGEAYSNVLNPWKDREKALDYFAKILDEFPDSVFVKGAKASIELLEESD